MEDDRRSERRYALSHMVAWDVQGDRYIQAHGCDISRVGMAFEAEEYVGEGLDVWLSYVVADANGEWVDLEAEGRVVHVSDIPGGCKFGVVFTRMTDEDRAALDLFIYRLEQGSSIPPVPGSVTPEPPRSI